jgi:hypothetical protein
MGKHTQQRPIAKSVIAIAVMITGSFSFYAGIVIDEKINSNNVKDIVSTTNSSSPSSAMGANPFALAFNQVSVKSTQIVPQGANSFTVPKLSTHFIPDAQSDVTENSERMTQDMIAQMELPADFVPNNTEGSADGAPFPRISLKEFSSGSKAITLLGNNLAAVAHWYGMSSENLRDLFLSDNTVFLDRKGRLLNIDGGVAKNMQSSEEARSLIQVATTAGSAASSNTMLFPLD